MKKNHKKLTMFTTKSIIAFIFVLAAIFYVYPLAWVIITSLKSYFEVGSNPFGFPEIWLFSNYKTVFSYYKISYIVNSIIYTFSAIAIILIVTIPYSYAISRMKFRFSNLFLALVIILMIVYNSQIGMIPGFIINMNFYRLYNTPFILPVLYGIISFFLSIIILNGFMRTLPYELEEAAYIDGASVFKCLISVIIPSLKPAISTVVILAFINSWNEFFNANIYIDSDYLKPITTGLVTFSQNMTVQYQLVAAGLIISSIPMIIIYLVMGSQIENALTTNSGLK